MRNERWLSWLPTIGRASSGLPYVLALLAAAFLVPEHCLAQPALGAAGIAASTGTAWVPTGNLNIARSGHTATLLSGGMVLVVGGTDVNGNIRDSAELYDPANGSWSITGRPNTPHAGHTATLLRDGRVLVVGSAKLDSIFDAAELYDPRAGTWTRAQAPATRRFDHTATLLQDGRVLVVGGAYAGSVSTVELYDPTTDAWRSTGSLVPGRALHQATLLQDGRVLITGGSKDADEVFPLSSADVFEPVAGIWSPASGLDTARYSHMATLLPNGKVIVAGGFGPPMRTPDGYSDIATNSAELFDPVTRRWSNTGGLNSTLFSRTATLLSDGKVLVTGGGTFDYGIELSRAELYDANRGVWEYTSAMTTHRSGHTATLLQNGKLLVAGGYGAGNVLNSAELFEPGAAQVAISAAFTGSWFNPAQNGHGFALEVLPGPPRQFLAAWFTFAPQGGQAWIVGVGPIDGNRAVLQGYQSAGIGARFPPNFDATNVHQEAWGTLTFTFSDCSHGHVDWVSSAPGYGSGGMDLTRLTLPAGLTC